MTNGAVQLFGCSPLVLPTSKQLEHRSCAAATDGAVWCCVAGDEDEDEEGEEGEERLPSCGDYVMHFLSLFWKVLFAFVPPTGI